VILSAVQLAKSGWERGQAEVLDIGMLSTGIEGSRQTAMILLSLFAMFILLSVAVGLQYGAIAFSAVTPVALNAGKRPWIAGAITGTIMAAVVFGLFDQMLDVIWPDPPILAWVQTTFF
jgi:hypothetical protein